MSIGPQFVEAITAQQMAEVRRVEDDVTDEEHLREAHRIMSDVVGGMNRIFDALVKCEERWREAVLLGDKPYSVEEDGEMVRMYREWAEGVPRMLQTAGRHSTPERPIAGLDVLARRAAQVAGLVQRPGDRLIDFPGIRAREGRPKLDVRPVSEHLAEHPEDADRVRTRVVAAEKSIAEGKVRPLSEYLLSRNGR